MTLLHPIRFSQLLPSFLITLALATLSTSTIHAQSRFVRGDCNNDGLLNVADPISSLAFLFSMAPDPTCEDSCDVNDDGNLDIADPVNLLSYLFAFGPEPAEPFAGLCGLDPTADNLTCLGPVPMCNSISDMQIIPAGSFQMGDHAGLGSSDQRPVHTVDLRSFAMDVFEVNNQQYVDFLNASLAGGDIELVNGSVTQSGSNIFYCRILPLSSFSRIAFEDGEFVVFPTLDVLGEPMAKHPMVEVSWYGAAAYANWRNEVEGKAPGYDPNTWESLNTPDSYRLPTEAQWEYAARGGQTMPYFEYPWGNDLESFNANFGASEDPYGPMNPLTTDPFTTPVGYYNGSQIPAGMDMANGFGLYDMAGNVNEWCNDGYLDTYYSISPVDNPTGPANFTQRVYRGGSFNFNAEVLLRCAHRKFGVPQAAFQDLGFRLVLNLSN